jgi:hypothetical protein
MSVKAHKITKFEFETCESFNLWHDTEVVNMLKTNGVELDESGSGIVSILVEDIKEIIKNENIDDRVREKLKIDKQEAEQHGDNEVLYYCF